MSLLYCLGLLFSTRHKLESLGKREPQLGKWPHLTALWARLWGIFLTDIDVGGLHHYRWYHFWDGGPGVYNKLVKQALEQTSKQHSFVASASASAIKSLP